MNIITAIVNLDGHVEDGREDPCGGWNKARQGRLCCATGVIIAAGGSSKGAPCDGGYARACCGRQRFTAVMADGRGSRPGRGRGRGKGGKEEEGEEEEEEVEEVEEEGEEEEDTARFPHRRAPAR